MVEPNEIIISKSRFGDKFWEVVAQQTAYLTRCGYACITFYTMDGADEIVIINYHFANVLQGDPFPYFLTPEEVVKLWGDNDDPSDLDSLINSNNEENNPIN